MAEVLIEIGTEEIPARFMPGMLSDLEKTARDKFNNERIYFKDLKVLGTDRRLTLILKDIDEWQGNLEEEIKGPPGSVPDQAKEGFCRKNNLDPNELTLKDGYYYGVKRVDGKQVKTILPELISGIITSLHLPIAMRWGDEDFRFVRPIHWIVALWDEEVIPFTLAGINSDRYSRGHRFLRAFGRISGDKGVKIASAGAYSSIMEESYVMVDQVKRKEKIRHDIENHPEVRQGKPLIDEDLLDEVTFLNEWPTVMIDLFDKKYLELPKEILITTMKKNQKYFPISDNNGELLTGFLLVSNNNRNEKNVLEGNIRVLTARLEDARFFYNEDRKISLKDRVNDLKNIVYQAKIGTLYEKMQRVEKICLWLSDKLETGIDSEELKQAAWLCKTDLLSSVVYEFPELQGTMGRIYAREENLPGNVSEAIYEHYLPRFAGDELPKTTTGAILAIAEKTDSICSCYAAGLIPSGSQDPYALRRAAAGIVSIILGKGWEIALDELVAYASSISTTIVKDSNPQESGSNSLELMILDFIKLRLKYTLQEEKNIDYDLVDMVLNQNELNKAVNLAELYQQKRNSEDFIKTVQSAVRIGRLSKSLDGQQDVMPELFQESIENTFWDLYQNTNAEINKLESSKAYDRILYSLTETIPVIEDYFEKVLVMDKEEKIKNNRLAVLYTWRQLFWRFGDWEKVVQVTAD
ncbi:glycine--tRNA ligase subunit beta [Candidatus Margulisiibacteriota bacterium]